MSLADDRGRWRRGRWAIIALVIGLVTACGQLRDLTAPAAPDLSSEWKPLLDQLRAFERSHLGFRETPNFARLTDEHHDYPYCGWSSKHVLPYSYEDPAIRWLDSTDAGQCRAAGEDKDWYFGSVEVWGEIGTPVTPAMVAGALDRFVYLVIHEDCHDQFDLPFGIEEPLCNIITYRAMAAFAAGKYRWYTRENRAIRNYGLMESRHTRTTVVHYNQLEALYAAYYRQEIGLEALMQARSAVFAKLERALAFPAGEMNNISIANYMTYSRHYAYLESVVDALGPDLARTVEFFRAIDARKPKLVELMQRLSIYDRKSLGLVRAYELAVIQTIEQARQRRGPPLTS